MNKSLTHKITIYAMLTALICAATLINIPSPGGYSNLGDGLVLISAFLFGPVCGMVTGAVGSAMADLILGCAYYIPGTIIVKGGTALLAGLIFSIGHKSDKKFTTLRLIAASIPAELWMVFGYWLYKSWILGNPSGAAVSAPRNLIQGAIGTVVAVILYSVFIKIPTIRKVSYYDTNHTSTSKSGNS